MPDTLHIVIHQGSSTRGTRGTRGATAAGGGLRDPEHETTLSNPDDPEHETTLSNPDDPEHETTLSNPDDPEHETTLSNPDDPRHRYATVALHGGAPWPPGFGAAYGTAYGAAGCGCAGSPCACACGEPPPARPEMAPRDYSGFVILRLAAGVELGVWEDLWQLARGQQPALSGLAAVLELESTWRPEGATPGEERPPVLRSAPLLSLGGCRGREQLIEQVRELERRAQGGRLRPLHSLTRYWRVDLRTYPDKAQEVVDALEALAEVDLAYRELGAADPQPAYGAAPEGVRLAEGQGYLDEAPAGIGARWAWAQPGLTTGSVKVCDLEQRWNLQHADLPGPFPFFHGANRDHADEEAGHGHHGTAVLGQLAAAERLDGGAEPVAEFALSSHYLSKAEAHPFAGTNGHVASAIVHTLLEPAPDPRPGSADRLQRGDVLLLEVQRGGLPTEVDAADFDAIRLASALGVVVVEAAGNGGRDLDAYVDPDTGHALRRGATGFRDSGAILVGAARSALPHDRASFSNFGSRLDCFAWGDGVTSCGYGDLAGEGPADYYTNTFSGTSSASPIIAAAAALVQALHPGKLDSRQMRALLSNPATGTRQGPNVAGHIGVMPDLRALVGAELQLVPEVYLRRSIGDDGTAPRRDDPISSSPDVMALASGKGAEVWQGPRANQPAPGGRAVPGGEYRVWTRLRNRGRGEGRTSVRLFASPAATLIPPDLWHEVGPESAWDVPQGDVAFEPDPVPFVPPAVSLNGWSPPPYSFLVVARPAPPAPSPDPFPPPVDRSGGLPPGGRWFDWAQYRAFLRSSGVAWRNVHAVGLQEMRELTFFLAGTPERERRFTFEVIQRLPAGATVSLTVPEALAVGLVQAQPLLTRDVPGEPLSLPSRPRTEIPGVLLPAGLRARAAFAVELAPPVPPASGEGYGLALRQLWRGEEVGRITWYLRTAPPAGSRAQ